jgi:inhibitor of cysteine peptidase
MVRGKRFVGLLALATAACVGLAALAGESAAGDKKGPDKEKSGKTVIVTEKQKGEKVKIARGDTLEVRLASNRTTGYSWAIAKDDRAKLKPQGKQPTYEPPKKGLPGAGGVDVFRFTAAEAGQTELVLVYRRPFEKGKEPARTFKITVSVE